MNDVKICLVVIFNHRYEKNIEKLKKIYENRFSEIFFLIPFYKSDSDERVLTCYDSSIYFHSFIPQNFDKIYNEKFTHYIFIADDLLLNTNIDEENILNILKVDSNASYIKKVYKIGEEKLFWPHWLPAIHSLNSRNGVDYLKELPDIDSAIQKIKSNHINYNKSLSYKELIKITFIPFRFSLNYLKMQFNYLFLAIKLIMESQSLKLKCPLLGGYSDFFIIPKCNIKEFTHYCGVFAATNTFVEVAIPTALVLSAKKIVYESDIKGVEMFDINILKAKEIECDYKLDNLFTDNKTLYYHPIKLSKWK